jgi:fumarylacetoacetate (FAA) hydrolase
MKLATHADGSRDGHLVVLSDDGALAHPAQGHCTRLQQLLDDWNFLSPQLQDLATTVTQGKARHAVPHDASLCLAPLPRAYRTVMVSMGGSAAASQAQQAAPLVGTERAASAAVRVLPAGSEARLLWPALVLITADVAAGCSPEQAADAVRLVGAAVLVDDQLLVHAPLVVTPDHLVDGARKPQAWSFVLQRLTSAGKASGPARPWPARWVALGDAVAQAAQGHALPAGAVVIVPALPPDSAAAGVLDDAAAGWTLEAGRAASITARSSHDDDLFGAIEVQGQANPGAADDARQVSVAAAEDRPAAPSTPT